MTSLRLALTSGLCAVGAFATAAPAVAAVAAPSAGCSIRFYFNQNSYLYANPKADKSQSLGLAYTNDTFVDMNRSSNGFRYGRDGRSGGATGWVRSENITSQKVCDV